MLLRVGSRRCQASSERDMARSPLKKRSGNAAEDIVRAAERLFGADGVSLVSLRQIALAANQVNNFAVQYHFGDTDRSEEHTSELQSLMRSSYAGFCLKQKKTYHTRQHQRHANENSRINTN